MLTPNNYYTVAGWMVTDLGLRGNELIAYAVIYGFSQVEDHRFRGSINYIAEWTGASRRTVIRVLNNLVERGLLIRTESETNNVRFPEYAAVVPSKGTLYQNDTGGIKMIQGVSKRHGGCQNDTGGVKMTPNNIDIDSSISPTLTVKELSVDGNRVKPDIEIKPDSIKPPSKRDKAVSTARQTIGYNSLMEKYNEICVSLPRCMILTDKRRKAIRARFTDGFTEEDFETIFRKAQASSFLRGATGFRAGFDFLIGEKAAKVLEGAYDDHASVTEGSGTAYPTYTDEEFNAMFGTEDNGDA